MWEAGERRTAATVNMEAPVSTTKAREPILGSKTLTR